MKKTLILIVVLSIISILLFVIFTKADYSKLTESEALQIGEEKYLQFLWMVDGTFNSERLNGDFVVNGKKLDDTNKKFTCTYKNKKDDSCVGNSFPIEFKKLFASNITYNDVYSDETFYTRFKYEKGKYIFTNIDNCSISRMNLNQNIKLESMDNNTLTYIVTIKRENVKKSRTKMFVLIREDNDWKVSRAYYHDVCEVHYYIG